MRKLAAFAAPFSAAVFALRYGIAPVLLLLPVLALLKREDRLLRCILVCGGLVAGVLWSAGYDAVFRAPAQALEGRTATLTGMVVDWPRDTSYGGSVTVRVRMESGPGFLARVYGGETLLPLAPGDSITFTADCRSADIVRGRSSSDNTSRGIYLLAYGKGEVETVRPERIPMQALPAHWSRTLKSAVAAAFPADAAPLMTALLTGDKSGLPVAEYTALQRSGLAHAVAVSGLHIGFLVQLAVVLSGSRFRRRTALIALPAMAVYALVAGCTPSVVRAVVMNALLLLGPLLGREDDPPTTLSFALMVLLLQNPYGVQSVGLQLSFVSVGGILAFSARVREWLWGMLPIRKETHRLLQGAAYFVTASLSTTVGALALTTPLTAFYFGTISLVAPLSNLLCLTLVAFLFQAGLVTTLLAVLSPALGAFLGGLAALPVRLLLWLVRGLSRVPFATVQAEGPYLLFAVTAVYLLWLLFLAGRGERRPLVPLCCSLLLGCAALVLTHAAYSLGPLTLTVLDVGQGQCVVLRAGDRTALVDCGGSARRNAGDLAADYLSTVGRDRVDLLVLTHFHADHANGVPELLERLEVSVLAVPDVDREDPFRQELLAAAESHGAQIWFLREDHRLPFGTADLTLYAPLGAGDANEEGLSLLIETEPFSALLTGDMGGDIETRLVKYGNLPDLDLLVAGHHGSRHATSQLLLDRVTPETAAISVGYNTYGHPAAETLLRLDGAGCRIYRTDLQGNITFTVG